MHIGKVEIELFLFEDSMPYCIRDHIGSNRKLSELINTYSTIETYKTNI